MGSAYSSMLWHDQVIEEEQQRGVVTKEEPRVESSLDPDAPLPGSEGGVPVMSQWLTMDLPNMTWMSW